MTAESPDPRDAIDILTTGISPDEAAAVVAVMSTALEEIRAEGEQPTLPSDSAWMRSVRAPRKPLERGTWRQSLRNR